MRCLVDTNVVARLAQTAHPQHAVALQAVERLLARADDPSVVPQVIYEFWVIATRPAAANGLGMSSVHARDGMAKIRDIFTLLRDERKIFQAWERLVLERDVKGKKAHDARIVAAMHRHGITHLLTFNDADFARYREITVLTPASLLAGE